MSVLTRWRDRLRERRGLLAAARRQAAYWRARKRKAKKGTPAYFRAGAMLAARERLVARRKRQVAYAKRVVARHSNAWGGSRAIIEEVVAIVDGRAPVTSRKRAANHPLSRGNPGSDHNAANTTADAVDFGIANAHWLKNEISRRLGGPRELPDFGTFLVVRNGATFRVQIIAGTHGTGPHLHVGVRRVS